MADHNTNPNKSGGGNGAIIFIVGGLVVAVAVLFFIFSGTDVDSPSDAGNTTNINVESPEGGNATAGATAETPAETSTETAPAATE